MRIGKLSKRLCQRLPHNEAALIWSKVNSEVIYNGYAELLKLKEVLKSRVEEKALFIEAKAEGEGERARHSWHSCGDASCSICGGIRNEHFHLSVEGRDGKLTLEEWIGKFLPADEALTFVSLIRNKDALCALIHYATIVFRNLGLLEEAPTNGAPPPMKRFILIKRRSTTGETKAREIIASKILLAMKGLEKSFPSLTTRQGVEPTIDHLGQVDWSAPLDSLPNKAKELLERVVTESHPSTLQWLLTIARRRIFSDFELWTLHRDIERIFKIGDMIYCRKRGVRQNEDLIE